ncbi:MAG: hypothetical protein ACLPND_03090 [Candidatus Korobacteraceae bacterium]
MPTDFVFRLNGTFIPEINVGRALIDGQQVGELQLSVRDPEVGWFTIDGSPDFVLEYRDEASWGLVPLELRRASTDKGWNRTTPQELIGVLLVAGVIK